MKKLVIFAGLILANFACTDAGAQTILLQDTFNVSSNGTGFAYGSGLNAGITTNPPATRLTGPLAPNLRYFASDASKAATAYTITNLNGGKMRVNAAANPGRVSLTDGLTAFNFAPSLGSAGATPTTRAEYEIAIKMMVNSAGTQRASFALSTVDGNNSTWDFGFQLHRVGSDNFYTISHRINAGSARSGTNVTTALPMTELYDYGSEISFLMKVWDAGLENGTNFNSRVQLFVQGTLFYDTDTDPMLDDGSGLPNRWRFDGGSRFLLWDVAGSGAANYDDLTVTSIVAPAAPNNDKIWTGGGADDNWSTGANWGGTAPTNGQGIVFAGTTRQSNFNDITGLTVPFFSISNGGFTLSGNPFVFDAAVTNFSGTSVVAADLSVAVTGGKSWWLLGGGELILSNTTTIPFVGDHSIYGGGTLRQKGPFNIGLTNTANPAFIVNEGRHVVDGTSFYSKGGYRIGSVAIGAGAKTILTNNASFTLAASGSNLRVGDSANPITAELQIHNSLLNMAGGNIGVGYATGSTGLVTQVGGTNMGGYIVFSDAGDARGTYTVKNGTLETFQIREDTATGQSTMQFDGAVLRAPLGAVSNYMSGLNLVQILAGGLTFDVLTNITVGQTIGGAGTLTKTGVGILTLSGNLNYAGTIVQSGALILTTGRTNTSSLQVADFAELGVKVTGVDSSRSNSSLSVGAGSSSTLSFDLSTNGTPVAPILKVGSLAVNGTVTVNITNESAWTLGDIVLIDYDGAVSGAFNFVLGTPLTGLPAGANASIVNDTANGAIILRISDASVLTFTSVSRQGNNVVMNGTGGVQGASYTVLSSTDLSVPLANWTPVASGTFGAGGTFGHTNSISTSTAFFVVKRP